jgi:hypothetical protein
LGRDLKDAARRTHEGMVLFFIEESKRTPSGDEEAAERQHCQSGTT